LFVLVRHPPTLSIPPTHHPAPLSAAHLGRRGINRLGDKRAGIVQAVLGGRIKLISFKHF
jgi:hypothetical protein